MGFFKNLFKKKKGGTLVGNLIRGVASSASGGLLGQGRELAKWEAQQEANKSKLAHPLAIKTSKKIPKFLSDRIAGLTGESPVETANWAIPSGVLLLVIALIVYKKSGKKSVKRR
jgi:hypothetical protein